jgi:triacylglycerol lipase
MNLVFATGVLFPQKIGPLEYFRGLPEHYPNALFPNVRGIGSVQQRAQQLAKEIRERNFPNGPIHIVAHSMGGLDARHFLVKGPKDITTRVASLSTVATPHHGSLIADLLAGKLGFFSRVVFGCAFRGLMNTFPSLRQNALDDLTTDFTASFNKEFIDVPTVAYYSYAGSDNTSLLLTPTHKFIAKRGTTPQERSNDGLVAVASATWTGGLAEHPWPADHFGVVGHNLDTLDLVSGFNHIEAYRRVVERALATPPHVAKR